MKPVHRSVLRLRATQSEDAYPSGIHTWLARALQTLKVETSCVQKKEINASLKDRCVHCNASLTDWQRYVTWENDWYDWHGSEVKCPECKKSFWLWFLESKDLVHYKLGYYDYPEGERDARDEAEMFTLSD